jgi:hypothetical protein
MLPRSVVVALLAALAVACGTALGQPFAPAVGTTPLRLNGIGPLHLGMTRQAALASGWLAQRKPGCELGGPPLPITYRLTGATAPKGVRGTAEFTGNRLRTLAFTGGVRTATGVEPGRTSAAGMVARYRAAGFAASSRYDDVFVGTFVTVKRNGKQVIGGFAEGGKVSILGIPFVPVCE